MEYKKSRIHIGYSNFFNLHMRYKRAFKTLNDMADFALEHSYNQDEARGWLTHYADEVLAQIKKVEDAQLWLEEKANQMLVYCATKDTIWLSLMRIGTKAYYYLVRQEEALEWLLITSTRMVAHNKVQDTVGAGLVKMGRHTLHYLNMREEGFAYLTKRLINAKELIERRAVCIAYLQRIPKAFYAVEDKKLKVFDQLVKIGARAKLHAVSHIDAFNKLVVSLYTYCYDTIDRYLDDIIILICMIVVFCWEGFFGITEFSISSNRTERKSKVCCICRV